MLTKLPNIICIQRIALILTVCPTRNEETKVGQIKNLDVQLVTRFAGLWLIMHTKFLMIGKQNAMYTQMLFFCTKGFICFTGISQCLKRNFVNKEWEMVELCQKFPNS